MAVVQTRFRYDGADGTPLAGFRWSAGGPSRAMLQLAHGAGEHSGRYREPLTPIVEAGFEIWTADHRGHGLTSGMAHLGDFGPGGAPAAVEDMASLARLARAERPDLPLLLMGHSMGAMFSQAFLPNHSDLIDALVLSGTAGPGPIDPGRINAPFEPARTPYDWLSRDEAEVDRYIADPFCSIRFTADSQASFLTLRERELNVASLSRVRSGLPVYVFVGDADPINDQLRRLQPLIDVYREAGLAVTLKVYPGGRHEMLNETNRTEVVDDLLAWLQATLPRLEAQAVAR
ncbi:MAG TPA: alpha/beta hydrolase [Caulobacteraceae bacterium]|jgi:alpha-beta hydrolase superfamily lysophospholipase|nr:alpha/beta hydrolase [Caulobacteraceae bacterium]